MCLGFIETIVKSWNAGTIKVVSNCRNAYASNWLDLIEPKIAYK